MPNCSKQRRKLERCISALNHQGGWICHLSQSTTLCKAVSFSRKALPAFFQQLQDLPEPPPPASDHRWQRAGAPQPRAPSLAARTTALRGLVGRRITGAEDIIPAIDPRTQGFCERPCSFALPAECPLERLKELLLRGLPRLPSAGVGGTSLGSSHRQTPRTMAALHVPSPAPYTDATSAAPT